MTFNHPEIGSIPVDPIKQKKIFIISVIIFKAIIV